MQGKKEELREFKFSRKLMEELPDTVQEEREHRGLRREKRDRASTGNRVVGL